MNERPPADDEALIAALAGYLELLDNGGDAAAYLEAHPRLNEYASLAKRLQAVELAEADFAARQLARERIRAAIARMNRHLRFRTIWRRPRLWIALGAMGLSLAFSSGVASDPVLHPPLENGAAPIVTVTVHPGPVQPESNSPPDATPCPPDACAPGTPVPQRSVPDGSIVPPGESPSGGATPTPSSRQVLPTFVPARTPTIAPPGDWWQQQQAAVSPTPWATVAPKRTATPSTNRATATPNRRIVESTPTPVGGPTQTPEQQTPKPLPPQDENAPRPPDVTPTVTPISPGAPNTCVIQICGPALPGLGCDTPTPKAGGKGGLSTTPTPRPTVVSTPDPDVVPVDDPIADEEDGDEEPGEEGNNHCLPK